MAKVTLEAVISATSKGLQNAMNAARQAVQSASAKMKQSISSIGDAFDRPIGKSRELKDSMQQLSGGELKQLMGGLTGMAGKIGIIIAGFKAMGGMVKTYVLDPILNAGKELREWSKYIASGTVKQSQSNRSRFDALEAELKEYARLLQQYNQTRSAVNKNALDTQQRKLAGYGVDINPNNAGAVIKEQMSYAKNGRIEALKAEIKATEDLREQLDKEYRELDRYSPASLDEKARRDTRKVEIAKERGGIQDTLLELRAQLRQAEKSNAYGDLKAEIKAQATDYARAQAAQKGAADRERDRYMANWKNDLADAEDATGFAAKVRKARERQLEAVDKGADWEEARLAAEKEITQAVNETYRNFLAAQRERIKAVSDAARQEASARNRLFQARQAYIKAIQSNAAEEAAEARDKKRKRLEDQKSDFGFDRTKPLTREERRNRKLDAAISDKQAREDAGERVVYTRREKERMRQREQLDRQTRKLDREDRKQQRDQSRQSRDDALSGAARDLAEARFSYGDARRNSASARRNLGRLKTADQVQNMLKGKADAVNASFVGTGLKAPGVKGSSAQMSQVYTGQLNQLHRDLQTIMQRAYIVR
ncbi:MAG: hypothetical protein J5746_12230 [Victivallales bacterium]|nr:hypothetical protein [Victivallales bacterium]